jgi:hypothetical protein
VSDRASLAAIGRAMRALLAQDGKQVLLRDPISNTALTSPLDSVAAPAGLLPVFLVAGEAVWREASGKGFALDITRDPEALLGYRVNSLGAGSFSTIMLSVMEATAQVARPEALVVNDLSIVWKATTERIDREAKAAAGPVDSHSISPR